MGLETTSPEIVGMLVGSAEFDIILQSDDDHNILDAIFVSPVMIIGFLVGLYGIKRGWDIYQKYILIKNTSTEQVRSIAMGRTEVEGSVQIAEEGSSKPFDAEECVYADWKIQEYTPSENEDGETEYTWGTEAVGNYGTKFYLAGESGREVLVDDPSGATVTLSDDATEATVVDAGEEPDEQIAQFCENQNLSPTSQWRRRYVQDVLVPDDEVYVLGEAVQRGDPVGPNNEDRILITVDRTNDEFLISDKSQQHLQEHYRKWTLISIGVGLLISVYSLSGTLEIYTDYGLGVVVFGSVVGVAILTAIYMNRERFTTWWDKNTDFEL